MHLLKSTVFLVVWFKLTVCQRIITVEYEGNEAVTSCIFEGSDEAVAWEITHKDQTHPLTLSDSQTLTDFKIWPSSNQTFNASWLAEQYKSNLNFTSSAKLDRDFGPLTDNRWNDLAIHEPKNLSDLTTTKIVWFSLYLYESSILQIILPHEQSQNTSIISVNLTENSATTTLEMRQEDGKALELFKINQTTDFDGATRQVQWKQFSLDFQGGSIVLKCEGKNLFSYSSFNLTQVEKIKFDSLTSKGIYLKDEACNVAEVTKLGDIALPFYWRPSEKKEKVCIAITYSSSVKVDAVLRTNKGTILERFYLKAATKWTVQKLLSNNNYSSGDYNFEIKNAPVGLYIGNIRICNEKEYFVNKVKQLQRKGGTSGLRKGDTCYSLRTKTRRSLERRDGDISSKHEELLANLTDLRTLICYNENCKHTTICVSDVGCFCWMGWKGSRCSEKCGEGKYGFNCNKPCGKCNHTTCHLETGVCRGCIDNSYSMPYCQIPGDIPNSSSNGIWVWIGAGISTSVLLAALATCIFFIVRKKRGAEKTDENHMTLMPRDNDANSNAQFNATTQSSSKKQFTTKENFRAYCEAALGSGQLEHEYEILPRGQQSSWDAATNPQNLMKNRYRQIAAYDYNRVILDSPPGYINASYITDYQNKKSYIATQGPKSETLNDFWQMVLQEQVSTIVMLCQVSDGEKIRCQQYWPSLNTQIMIGSFTIYNKAEKQHKDFVERTLTFKYSHGSKQIVQLHYTEWPRQGVPTDLSSIADMMEILLAKRQMPLLIHCSGGTGRTGAIILADQCLRRLVYENKIDVFSTLKRMRQERVNMVDKVEQYVMVHELIIYYLRL